MLNINLWYTVLHCNEDIIKLPRLVYDHISNSTNINIESNETANTYNTCQLNK